MAEFTAVVWQLTRSTFTVDADTEDDARVIAWDDVHDAEFTATTVVEQIVLLEGDPEDGGWNENDDHRPYMETITVKEGYL